jgi:ATP-dependent DNA helicase RecG
LDDNYARVLFEHQDFDIRTVYLIDRVQKNLPLNKEQIKLLRNLKVIEGKAPHLYISAVIAEIIDEKEQYIKNRGQEDSFYQKMIVDYLKKWGKGQKNNFIKLLSDK